MVVEMATESPEIRFDVISQRRGNRKNRIIEARFVCKK